MYFVPQRKKFLKADSKNARKMRGFTLLELMVALGIIGVLASVILPSLNIANFLELRGSTQAQNDADAIKAAVYLASLDKNPELLSIISSTSTPICRTEVTGDPTCIAIADKLTEMLPEIPVLASETNPNYSGFKISQTDGRMFVIAEASGGPGQGQGGGESGSSASSEESQTPPGPTDYIAYWSFDEGMGTVAADGSVNGWDGTLSGNPQWVSGKHGSALEFDGVTSLVNTTFQMPNTYTLAAWIKLVGNIGTGTYETIMAVENGNSAFIDFEGNNASFWADDLSTPGTSYGITDVQRAVWHHIAFIREADSTPDAYKVYWNGQYTGGDSTGVWSGNGNLTIGGRDGETVESFKGAVDDVRIYSRALTAEEVAALAQNN